jgi:hypothetical protein
MRVKGSMIVDYVRLIRANKDREWDKYLKPEDWEIINNRVLPAFWYAYDSCRRIGLAVYHEIAQADLATTKIFGRFVGRNLLEIYHHVLAEGDPVASIEALCAMNDAFSDGEAGSTLMDKGPGFVKIRFQAPDEEDREFMEAFCAQIVGIYEEVVDQAGGNNVHSSSELVGDRCDFFINWE